jgi:hypothetical protein
MNWLLLEESLDDSTKYSAEAIVVPVLSVLSCSEDQELEMQHAV